MRQTLLEAAGIPVEMRPADLDERGLEAEGAIAGARRGRGVSGARKGCRRSHSAMPGRLVLGADQTLALDGERFSKPADRAAARAQLARAVRPDP